MGTAHRDAPYDVNDVDSNNYTKYD